MWSGGRANLGDLPYPGAPTWVRVAMVVALLAVAACQLAWMMGAPFGSGVEREGDRTIVRTRGRWLPALLCVGIGLLAGSMMGSLGGPWGLVLLVPLLLPAAAVAVRSAVLGVEAGPEGLLVRNPLQTVRIPWDDVAAITFDRARYRPSQQLAKSLSFSAGGTVRHRLVGVVWRRSGPPVEMRVTEVAEIDRRVVVPTGPAAARCEAVVQAWHRFVPGAHLTAPVPPLLSPPERWAVPSTTPASVLAGTQAVSGRAGAPAHDRGGPVPPTVPGGTAAWSSSAPGVVPTSPLEDLGPWNRTEVRPASGSLGLGGGWVGTGRSSYAQPRTVVWWRLALFGLGVLVGLVRLLVSF
jgi:hypothetical protein